jgi:hypothetical protein
MPNISEVAPWLIPGQTAGDNYARIMAQNRQQGMEGQRLGMERQQFQDQRASAAAKAQAQQDFGKALKGLDPKDPNYQKDVARLMLQFGPQLGIGGTGMGGALKAFTPPVTASPLLPQGDDSGATPSPAVNPKTQPSLGFTGQPQDILKGAGVAPKPVSPPVSAPPTTGSVPPAAGGSKWAQPPMLLSNGRVIPGKLAPPPQQMRPIPRGAIGQGPNGQMVTNTPPASGFNLGPGQIRYDGTGKPIATNTQPRTVSRPPASGPSKFDLQTHAQLLKDRTALMQLREDAPDADSKAKIDGQLQDNWADIQELEKKGKDKASTSSDRSPQGGYKIGGTYAGGLKYIGGDPKDESSWQKAGP